MTHVLSLLCRARRCTFRLERSFSIALEVVRGERLRQTRLTDCDCLYALTTPLSAQIRSGMCIKIYTL